MALTFKFIEDEVADIKLSDQTINFLSKFGSKNNLHDLIKKAEETSEVKNKREKMNL